MSDRVMQSLANISNLPASFSNNAVVAFRNFLGSITGTHADFFKVHFMAVSSASLVSQIAFYYKQDEGNRQATLSKEKAVSFDLNGVRLASTPTTDIYSIQDIEQSLFTTRDYLQQAILADRDNQSLFDLAASLVRYVDETKLKKRNIISVQTNNIPLNLLCSSFGLSYKAAERVLKINPGIKNPTFCEGTVKVYAS
jgi:prophage DNA circulation protein